MTRKERIERAALAYEYIGMACHGMEKATAVLRGGHPDEDRLRRSFAVQGAVLGALEQELIALLTTLRMDAAQEGNASR